MTKMGAFGCDVMTDLTQCIYVVDNKPHISHMTASHRSRVVLLDHENARYQYQHIPQVIENTQSVNITASMMGPSRQKSGAGTPMAHFV